MERCIICGGPLVLLGELFKLAWFRCRDCGMDQAAGGYQPPDDSDEEQE